MVWGADDSIPLKYTDPKVADGTSKQSEAYKNTSHIIAVEMAYIMENVRSFLSS